MGAEWPKYPDDVSDGDEPSHSPNKSQNSLLATERGNDSTRRLETDADNNLFVNVASGTITTVPSGTQDIRITGQTITVAISAASLPLPTGAATSSLQTQPGVDIGDVTVNNGSGAGAVNIQDGGNSITVDGPLTDSQLRATPVPVTIPTPVPVSDNGGSLTVDGTIAVSNFPATQPVSGPLTNTELRAIPVPVDTIEDLQERDLFGRARFSVPASLFDCKFSFDKQPLIWDESLTTGGTATFNSNESCIDMAVTTTSGSRVIRQTKEYVFYEPGKSQQCQLTTIFAAAKTNLQQMVGMFDDNDGLFFQLSNATFSVVVRSSTSGSPVNTVINQSDFNLDKLDGTGASGMTIDLTKAQLYVIEYQWFGVGTIRFGVYYNGKIIYCHQVHHANASTVVWAKRGSFPVRYEIVNTGTTASSSTLKQICIVVNSEAGYTPRGTTRGIDSGTSLRSAASINLPLLSIRLKSAYNRATIIPTDLTVIASTADNFRYQILLNASLTGASFASVATESAAEYDIAATALTGGTILADGYSSNQVRQQSNYQLETVIKLCANIAGTSDTLTLAVQAVPVGSISVFGSLGWREYI